MGIETLLLPGGIALFGAIALFWIAIYKGIFSRSAPIAAMSQGPIEAQSIAVHQVPENVAAEPVPEVSAPQPAIITSTITTAPVLEAPPPFEEPQTAFTNPTISSTALPTDTTAVTNITNPVENIGPVLVIARPKRATRTKRLPSTGTPRRRRSTRAKTSVPPVESVGATGQQNQVNQ
jgi:hypothetical protein